MVADSASGRSACSARKFSRCERRRKRRRSLRPRGRRSRSPRETAPPRRNRSSRIRSVRTDVVVRQRAAAVAVREDQHRITRRRVGPQRRVAAALHVRHRPAGGQRIVGPRIGGGRRVTDHHDVAECCAPRTSRRRRNCAARSPLPTRCSPGRPGGRSHCAACRRRAHAFPVEFHVFARGEAAEVLRDVAARDGVRAGQRQGWH